MDAVENRYGGLARDLVHNLLLLGHTKVSDLAEAYESNQKEAAYGKSNGHPTINGVNGHAKVHATTVGQLHNVLYRLLEAGVVEPVVENMLRSPSDIYNKLEKEILKESYGGSTKGTKQKEEVAGRIRDGLQALRSEGRDWKSKANKRPLNGEHTNGINGSTKRRRLSHGGGVVNGDHVYEDDGTRLDPDLVIRINHEKCTVVLRNLQLVELANTRIGKTTSQIYAQLLRHIEEKIPRCQLDPKVDDPDDISEGPSVSTMEIAAALSKSINVGTGIGKTLEKDKDKEKVQVKKGVKRNADEMEAGEAAHTNGEQKDANGNGAENDHDSEEDSDDPFADEPATKAVKRPTVTFQDKLPKSGGAEERENRMTQVKNHLQLLAEDEYKFIRKCGIRGVGEWTVDFARLVGFMREAELDQLLFENFGQSGRRLARMMRKLGKLDEKQLPNLALMKQKDVRTKLAEMQMAGVVDIQEVPKDSSRSNNARTIFLWYFDPDRVSAILLDKIYKAMSRLLQRLDVERRQAHGILELTERSDVRDQSPEEYLTGAQLNDLHDIERREQTLIGQVARLDELVGIFRDY
ncbi:hypothetical protein G7Y89_g12428 [Cudoniella acicularis]|uniref:DNA-directed RNA polymerase III subunit RPC3 n=1 Tax=Cudoniella acicularis TaxID=354080 RepID=A0A8H4RCK9_9HELO|nr:hypothetical protein G7Y89_g12428 [Cudoniella acicularis]